MDIQNIPEERTPRLTSPINGSLQSTRVNPSEELREALISQNDMIELPRLNEITIPEEERPLDLDPADSDTPRPPYYSSVARIMYAAGDAPTPRADSIQEMCSFIQSLYFLSNRSLSLLLSEEVLSKAVKYYSDHLSSRNKFFKFLKYFEKQFPLETCTYFSSMEIKKSLGIEEGNGPEGEERKEKMIRKRLHLRNPVAQMESNLRLEKYDKIRQLRTQKVMQR